MSNLISSGGSVEVRHDGRPWMEFVVPGTPKHGVICHWCVPVGTHDIACRDADTRTPKGPQKGD